MSSAVLGADSDVDLSSCHDLKRFFGRQVKVGLRGDLIGVWAHLVGRVVTLFHVSVQFIVTSSKRANILGIVIKDTPS